MDGDVDEDGDGDGDVAICAAEIIEVAADVDFERWCDNTTFLERGEEENDAENDAENGPDSDSVTDEDDVDEVIELNLSFGLIKETEDSFFLRNNNDISPCLRLQLELEIRGGGIVGIGDLVDNVLK